MKENYFQCD